MKSKSKSKKPTTKAARGKSKAPAAKAPSKKASKPSKAIAKRLGRGTPRTIGALLGETARSEPESTPIMPPRLKNWTEGTPQIGVFIRTAEGRVVEASIDKATPEMAHAAFKVLHWISSGVEPPASVLAPSEGPIIVTADTPPIAMKISDLDRVILIGGGGGSAEAAPFEGPQLAEEIGGGARSVLLGSVAHAEAITPPPVLIYTAPEYGSFVTRVDFTPEILPGEGAVFDQGRVRVTATRGTIYIASAEGAYVYFGEIDLPAIDAPADAPNSYVFTFPVPLLRMQPGERIAVSCQGYVAEVVADMIASDTDAANVADADTRSAEGVVDDEGEDDVEDDDDDDVADDEDDPDNNDSDDEDDDATP